MVFTFIQISRQETLSCTVKGSKTWNVYTGDFVSLRLIYLVQHYSPSIILHLIEAGFLHTFTIYKRRNPSFFAFSPITLS